MRIELDGLEVDVKADGEREQPWDRNELAYAYVVTVEGDGVRYETPAYGSQVDYRSGQGHEAAAEEIGYMVLDELLSAAYDPDEWFRMALDDDGDGTGNRERAVGVLAMIDTAEAMLPALERNQEAIEDHR